jgi:hypothetical protein
MNESRICFSRSDRTPGGAAAGCLFARRVAPHDLSVHGTIAEHYKIDPAALKESHASTLD